MNLELIKQRYAEDLQLKRIAQLIKRNNSDSKPENERLMRIHLKGLIGSSLGFTLGTLHELSNCNLLIITDDKEEAAYLQNDIEQVLSKKEPLLLLDSFKKPGKFQEPLTANIQLRTEVINRISNNPTHTDIVITYPEAIIEKVVELNAIKKSTLNIVIHEKLNEDFIIDMMNSYGFERFDFVYEPGQYAIRGGILDIFSFGNEKPYRIELNGDDVESIRIFDPITQLSEKKISQVTIIPNIQTQFESEEKVGFLDFISKNTFVACKSIQFLSEKLELLNIQAADLHDQLGKNNYLKEDHPLLKPREEWLSSKDEVLSSLMDFNIIEYGKYHLDANEIYFFNTSPQPSINKNFNLLLDEWKKLREKQYDIFLFSDNKKQIERFYSIFEDLKSDIQFHPLPNSLKEGFIDEDRKLACYTDHQIFNRYHHYRIKQGFSKSKSLNIKLLQELKPGDFVTHIDHGVGVFSGLEKVEINGQLQEAVRLLYRDNDLLYVNIQSLHKISKFVGKDGSAPRVNKLGTDTWETLKRKTKTKVKDIAKDLIKLYALRRAKKGFSFSNDTYLQTELEASFIYEDTPDQLKATLDVKRDMEKSYPMDRLVCGDVGFGKTEIAIRAAFKAVADNKQVAVLVPTTILALQHYKTFADRLKEFPCRVDYINRFKSAKQQKETLKDVEDGKVDILIGTHAIIGSRVKFKDLGLLIIDEEQKFGVGAKEKLRQMKANVDTLILTATPIPRTLQFSMMGARDLSIINTPPPNRQPIDTELTVLDPNAIKEAIEYEVYRGGQVFFVHNRVKDIEEVAMMLKNICPGFDIAVAHGQMEGHVLEDKLTDFIERKYDVLVSTNIVEAGLDIPNANTIIINDAQNFGMSDLHQLRGRVGRSNKKAFCYLLTPPLSTLSSDSRKRLQTIEEFSELGSGFQVAMRDMDIRGAGNLLGGEQSGFISDIGYDTYHKILDEAIQELKETDFKDVFTEELSKQHNYARESTIETDVEMLIPDEYVNNINERLALYTELDNIKDEDGLIAFEYKLIDRFGAIPKQVYELFEGMRLRKISKQLGFERVVIKKSMMRCSTVDNPESPYYESDVFAKVLAFVTQYPHRASMKQTPNNILITINGIKNMHQAKELMVKINEMVIEQVK
jgi:transcription-repair coupling factor (superfamily II helicase)